MNTSGYILSSMKEVSIVFVSLFPLISKEKVHTEIGRLHETSGKFSFRIKRFCTISFALSNWDPSLKTFLWICCFHKTVFIPYCSQLPTQLLLIIMNSYSRIILPLTHVHLLLSENNLFLCIYFVFYPNIRSSLTYRIVPLYMFLICVFFVLTLYTSYFVVCRTDCKQAAAHASLCMMETQRIHTHCNNVEVKKSKIH